VTLLQLVTTSRLKAYRACARLHFYQYVENVRPIVDGEARSFGSLIHAGLELWWMATDARLDAALDALERHHRDAIEAGAEPDEYRLAKARALLTGYDVRWRGEDLTAIAVEQEFRAPLTNPETNARSRTFDIGGKIDAIARTGDGRTLIVEHKTSTEDITPGSRYWRQLRMDGQISMYYDGAAALGYDVEGCIYDVLKTPQQKPYKATPEAARRYTTKASRLKDGTLRPAGSLHAGQRDRDETVDEYGGRIMAAIAAAPDDYYQRGNVDRLDDEMREHHWDTWQHARSLRDALRTGVYPRNPDACDRYHRLCDFFEVCTGGAAIDDPTKFTRGDAHPELTQVAKEEPTHDDSEIEFGNPF
jgi:hypothetical protein